jgi:aminopeptidase-like protein
MSNLDIGNQMHAWARDLFPITRSITGEGVRHTLRYIQDLLPDLRIHGVPTGAEAFDWIIPDEWNVTDAFIANESGERLVDFRRSNLHLVSYSEPVDAWLEREQLETHLYSLPESPDAIPYVTSYYARRWGFCLTHRQRSALPSGRYHAVVRSELQPGVLNFADLILPGEQEEEILLSTYICHPSMGNNELSGPIVAVALARWLMTLPRRRYTYRIVFVPETIGAIVYLSRHWQEMKARTVAGFMLTCVGDERTYSYLPSRMGTTLADRVARHILDTSDCSYDTYSFLDRGSDERQYCSPLIDLPVVSIMRSKYGTYPEYHTSLDDLSFITPAGLSGGYEMNRRCLEALERNAFYAVTTYCEPKMDRRGLRSTVGGAPKMAASTRDLMNLLAYADGRTDLIDIANIIGRDVFKCAELATTLEEAGLLRRSGS